MKNRRTIGDIFLAYVLGHCKPQGVDCKRVGYVEDKVVAFFGRDKDAAKITRADCRDYATSRVEAGASPGTIRRELGVLKTVLTFACDEELIAAVPSIKMPPATEPTVRVFTQEEVARLFTQPMTERTRLFLLIAMFTGARAQAIEQLTWDRVDFAAGLIDFRVPGQRKTRKRRAVVPIADMLRPALEAERARSTGPYVIGAGSSTYRAVKQVLRAAGIAEHGVCRHAFRKTYASWAVQAGVPIAKVAAVLGDTIQTTERNYARLIPGNLASAVNFNSR